MVAAYHVQLVGLAERTEDDWNDPRKRRATVRSMIYQWVDLARSSPSLSWPEAGPNVVIAHSSLLAALVLQLVFAASRVDGFAICSACGRPYTPSRKPQAGRKNYCRDPECKNRAAWREGQRRQREGIAQPRKPKPKPKKKGGQ